MPLSFRRSYKKLPGASINREPGRRPDASDAMAARPPREFQARSYPLAIPIGCGLAIAVCGFLAFSRGLVRLPIVPAPTPLDYSSLATSAFETALADQWSTVASPQPTDTSSPLLSATVTAEPLQAPQQLQVPASNPWAASIPNAGCIPSDLPQTGRVVEIVNGDTIKVLLDSDGRVYSVHYLGVTAPDTGANFGSAALARNTGLAYHQKAVLVRDITDADANGTLLRYVMVGDVFVNEALVAEGYARTNMSAPDTACLATLLAAEQQARAERLGLWVSEPDLTVTP